MNLRVNEFSEIAGYHGYVYADCDSGSVTHIRLEEDAPPEVPVRIVKDLRYAPTLISGHKFLLPASVEEIARYRSTVTKLQVEFRNYRRYGTKTKITFDEPKP